MRFTTSLAVSAFAALASAQTWTLCNPMEKDCPNDPAMAAVFETNFAAGPDQVKGWKQTAGSLTYGQEGAEFVINKQGDSPTIQSETYLHFGYVEVKVKASGGTGIISSIVLQSENLDEVDWEFIGGRPGVVQTNYFGKGNTTTYDRMIEYPVQETQTRMHTYSIDWTAERIIFAIDGAPVRTLNYADANGGKNYPQTPSTVRIGIWAGGDPNNGQGVIEWAGGKTDYTKAPFKMVVESVRVRNYSPGKEYEWTDRSGSWESIKVIGEGDQAGAPENTKPLEPTATATGDGGLASDIDVPSATGSVPSETAELPAETEVSSATGSVDLPAGTDVPSATDSSPSYTADLPAGTDVPSATDYIPSYTSGMPVGTGYPIGTGVGSLPSTSCTDSVIPPYPTNVNSTVPAGGQSTYPAGPTPPVEYPTTFISSVVASPSTGGEVPPPAGTDSPYPSGEVPPPVGTGVASSPPFNPSPYPSGEVPPPVGTGVASSPPFNPSPYPSGEVPPPVGTGISVDTAPAPSVPFPTGGASVSSPPAGTDVVEATPEPSSPLEFVGAASTAKVGTFVAFAAAAAMLFV